MSCVKDLAQDPSAFVISTVGLGRSDGLWWTSIGGDRAGQGHGKVGSCWSELQVFEDAVVVAGVVAERAGDVGGPVEA